MGEVRAHVRHRSGYQDARALGQLRDLGCRAHTDNAEQRFRHRRTDAWKCLLGEPGHGVDVRPIVHRAGKHQRRPRAGKGVRIVARGVEEVTVDALYAVGGLVRRFRGQSAEQVRLFPGYEHRAVELACHAALECQQLVGFAAVEPAHRPGLAFTVAAPFL